MRTIGLGSAKCSCTSSSKKAASGKLKSALYRGKSRARTLRPFWLPALSERRGHFACQYCRRWFMVSTDKAMAMTGFFEEVKRRKVYRVAAAYIIAAGGIIQLASAAFPAWELPNWALRLVIVLLLLGFPIALIL